MIKEIYFDNRSGAEADAELLALIEKSIEAALAEYSFEEGYQVSVSLVDKDEIQKLNGEYRGVDSVTDVLSFPMEEKDARGIDILGDIVICMQKACEQAQEYGHSVSREAAYLSVHSVLHLLGYDHENEDDKANMRKQEELIMNKLGLLRE